MQNEDKISPDQNRVDPSEDIDALSEEPGGGSVDPSEVKQDEGEGAADQ
jgi:hypothetical protein